MESSNDQIGANIKALQNRVCIEYATTMGRFRQADLERKLSPLNSVDAASGYTLIPPAAVKGFTRCEKAFAIFTLLEQKPIKRRQGLCQSYSLLVSIKCEYINTKGRITKYLFQVVADHDACNYGYFHQIQVNQDGSLLLLVAGTRAWVARVPTEMDESSVIVDEASLTFLHTDIVRAEALQNAGVPSRAKLPYKLIKAEFHPRYNNIICLLTMEQKEDSGDHIREQARATQSDSKFMELEGVMRIFDVENSIDHPYLEMHLTEQICRTGQEASAGEVSSAADGAVVDFTWNTRDQSTWGSSTLFVMSNYGYVFLYCPVILPGCLNSFRRKSSIFRAAADLMKNGFEMKTAPSKQEISEPRDVAKLLSCLSGKSQGKDEAAMEGFQIIPSVFKLESYDSNLRQRFDGIMVLSTRPELSVAATVMDGSILQFKSYANILPHTSHFSNKDSRNETISVPSVAVDRSRRAHCGVRTHLVPVTHQIFLVHSVLDTSLVRIGPEGLDVKQVSQARLADDHTYYQSRPLVVTGSGDRSMDDSFARYYNDPQHNIYLLQASCCYTKSQEELKQLTFVILPMPNRELCKINEELDHINMQKMDITPRVTSGKAITNAATANQSYSIDIATHKLVQRALEMQLAAQQCFRNAKQLVRTDMSYKEKTVELVKTISSLDSSVMLYLKARKPLEGSVQMSIHASNEIADRAKQVIDTIPDYVKKLEQMQERVERLKQGSLELIKKEMRVVALEAELQQLRADENAALRVTDLITGTYLRWSQKLSKSMTCKVQTKEEKLNNYKACIRGVIDQWVAERFQKNIELMDRTFRRMQNIRNRMIELE